ncbi:MAG: UDP-N-acetylmuramoyl-L-alanyl-D-glutamate--2,6-diaminopimelate ligase [Actinomycetota bacterium]|nr:UDP-N-acetylmuramoyl-L-alanyl-D-glutamate--2,6-diaminopimelate ligase [Actinomycetota bacterium]
MGPQPPRGLDQLAAAASDLLVEVRGDPSTLVGGLAYDSRSVTAGDLFFCIPGARADGHAFARAATDAGATSLCVERPTGSGSPEVVVSDARRAMARMAAAWFGHPADDMLMLGVTGTNGKTTTAFLLESILKAAGYTVGLIGTIETHIGDERRPGIRTTPESLDLQEVLAEMRVRDVGAVAMEVTSHALALHRVEGIRFAAAGFTNLSQDHLDFHAGMDPYFDAKRALFEPGRCARGAANADDPWGRALLARALIPMIGFGGSEDADLRASDVTFGPSGTRFSVRSSAGGFEVATPLVGGFNVSNCLAAAAVALQAGIDPAAVEAGLNGLTAVPGRFESIDEGQPFTVVVDYAHTPDSLDNVLAAARSLAATRSPDARVICAFGCGGDRDAGKRPLMGSVVARLADVVIVTSDNPRSEVPGAIIDQILEGVVAMRPDGPDAVLEDRRAAIERAIGAARPDDVVVIAGKGHETGQEFADRTIPFDDRVVARAALRARNDVVTVDRAGSR